MASLPDSDHNGFVYSFHNQYVYYIKSPNNCQGFSYTFLLKNEVGHNTWTVFFVQVFDVIKKCTILCAFC